MTDGLDQSQYQVRFEWGIGGAVEVAMHADVAVVVDVLGFSTEVERIVAAGGELHLTATQGAALGDGLRVAERLASGAADVVAGSLRNAAAVAQWALARQADKGDRFMVAVIAAGETRQDGSTRFALADMLGAGAIIDALAEVGIDYCSPEAAAAAAAYTGLRNATGHLIGASSSGRKLTARGFRADVDLAIEFNASSTVPVLREFVFRADG